MSKVRRSRDEWRRLVRMLEESREDPVVFAVRHDVSPRTLRWWSWRLRETSSPIFIPVEVGPVSVAPTRSMRMEARLASGVVLAFEDVDAAMLRELVAALGDRA